MGLNMSRWLRQPEAQELVANLLERKELLYKKLEEDQVTDPLKEFHKLQGFQEAIKQVERLIDVAKTEQEKQNG